MTFDSRYVSLERIARTEFTRLVVATAILEHKLRISLKDGSYFDVWFSEGRVGVYAFHCERRHLDGTFYRHDNIPHAWWKHITSWPKHFHNGGAKAVEESGIPDTPGGWIKIYADIYPRENKVTTTSSIYRPPF